MELFIKRIRSWAIPVLVLSVAASAQERVDLHACMDSCQAAISEGEYAVALSQVERALFMAKELRDTSAIAGLLLKRSTARMMQGDYNASLMDLHDALGLYERLGDEDGVADAYNSIGSIHYYDRNYTQARQYYERSLAIRQRRGERAEMAMLFGNIGSVLEEMEEPDSALVYHHRHLAIRKAENNTNWIPICYTNLGVCHDKAGSSDSALYYLQASLTLYDKGDKMRHARGHAMSMLGLAWVRADRPGKAIPLCTDALEFAKALGDLPLQKQCYGCLYKAFHALGNESRAFFMHQRYVAVRDSIYGEQRAKELVRIELLYNFKQERLSDSLRRVDEQRQAEFSYQQRISRERDQKRVFLFSAIGVLLFAGGLFSRLRYIQRSRTIIREERDRSDRLLLNILPAPIAEELKAHGRAQAREVDGVSILFTDFHEFTRMSEYMTAQELVAEIDACFRAFDRIAAAHGVEKIKTIGDAYMAAAGLPAPREGSARDAVLAAMEMQAWLKARSDDRAAQQLPVFTMRVGIHTGPVVAGIVGDTKFQYDLWGDTVNTAARMESAGVVGEVNISQATYECLKEEQDLRFTPRGRVAVKGKGELRMYFVSRSENDRGHPVQSDPVRGILQDV